MDAFDSGRRKMIQLLGASGAMALPGLFLGCGASASMLPGAPGELASPNLEGDMSLEEALYFRHSEREFAQTAMSFEYISQLLWAAQGQNAPRNVSGSPAIGRTIPSAGALYPLELYLFARNVEGLDAGLYRYEVNEHALTTLKEGDQTTALRETGSAITSVTDAAVTIVIGGVVERTSSKYGNRADRYVAIEVGCAAQVIYMHSLALGMGTVFTGAFSDSGVVQVIGDTEYDITPYGVMPIGYLKS